MSAPATCIAQVCSSKSPAAFELFKNILSIAAIPIGILTFWLGFRQREHERTRSYYQKVVVDVVIQPIIDTFDDQIERLTGAGQEALRGTASARKTVPRSCSIALADFSKSLFDLQDKVLQRTLIFDEDVSTQLEVLFQQTQDDLTAWFNDIGLHKRRDISEIPSILRANQRMIIRTLYRGETRTF